MQSSVRCKEGWPGGTTLQAKFRVPISDYNFFRVQDFLCSKSLRHALSFSILSEGSLACILLVSKRIFINSRTWEGACVLPSAIGIPIVLKMDNMLSKLV